MVTEPDSCAFSAEDWKGKDTLQYPFVRILSIASAPEDVPQNLVRAKSASCQFTSASSWCVDSGFYEAGAFAANDVGTLMVLYSRPANTNDSGVSTPPDQSAMASASREILRVASGG